MGKEEERLCELLEMNKVLRQRTQQAIQQAQTIITRMLQGVQGSTASARLSCCSSFAIEYTVPIEARLLADNETIVVDIYVIDPDTGRVVPVLDNEVINGRPGTVCELPPYTDYVIALHKGSDVLLIYGSVELGATHFIDPTPLIPHTMELRNFRVLKYVGATGVKTITDLRNIAMKLVKQVKHSVEGEGRKTMIDVLV